MEKTARVAEYKKKIVQSIVKCIKEYPIIGVVNMESLPAPQLQAMRAKLRGKVYLIMTKKRLMKIALEQVKNDKKGIEDLEKYFEGMVALLFTKDSPFKLSKTLQESKSPAPAKAGQTAPKDLIIPKGPTGFAPGPIISELGSVGIKTGVEQGKVAVKEDSLVAKKGEKIQPKVAEVLARMGVEPMEVGLDLVAAYDDGVVYSKDILQIDEKEFMGKLNSACSGAVNLAMFIEYPTKDTINLLLGKAFNDAKAIGLSQNIIDEGVIEELLGKAETGMLSLKDSAKIEVQEKPKEEKKEEPKPEVKVEGKKEEPKAEEKKPEVKGETKAEVKEEPEVDKKEEEAKAKVGGKKEEPVVKKEPKPEEVKEPKPETKPEEKKEVPKPEVEKEAEEPKKEPESEVKPEETKEVPKPEERKEIPKTEEKPAKEKESVIEKEILDEEKQIEKKTDEEVREKPEEKEVKEAIKEETEKELEKEKPESKDEVKEVKPAEASKIEMPEPEKAEDVYEKEERQELTAEGEISPAEEGFMEGYEEAGKTEEEKKKPESDVDGKVKKMVEETKKFTSGDKGPSADDLINEVQEEEPEAEKVEVEEKEEVEKKPEEPEKEEPKKKENDVPSAHELTKKKAEDEQKEVEDLAKELIKKGTLRK